MRPIVAIHQPNFLPWLGFFDKWRRSDTFVLLDHVQFSRRSYLSRVGIVERGASSFLSVPVHHQGKQEFSVAEAQIDSSQWRPKKILKRLHYAYGKCPYWGELEPALESHLCGPHTDLLSLNLALLRWLGELLELDSTKLVLQSSLEVAGAKSALMAGLTRTLGGEVYLSGGRDPSEGASRGPSAADYNDPEVYAAYGVTLRYQNFQVSPYAQGVGSFVGGVSALDLLAWKGPQASAAFLRP